MGGERQRLVLGIAFSYNSSRGTRRWALELHEFHGRTAAGVFEMVTDKRREDTVPPAAKGKEYLVISFGNGIEEFFVTFPVARIDTIVANLFENFSQDMLDEAVYKIECEERFHDQQVILVAVIMKNDRSLWSSPFGRAVWKASRMKR